MELNARLTDSDTSHAAAATFNNDAVYENVAELFQVFGPMTDEQLTNHYANIYGMNDCRPDSPRKRRSDLRRDGKVINSGDRSKSVSGRNVIVWSWRG